MQNKSYNICLVVGSLGMGGAERSIVELANYLVSLNQNVAVISLSQKEHFFYINNKVQVIEPMHYNKKKLIGSKFILGCKTLVFIRTAIKKLKPDVIYSVALPTLFLLSTIGISCPIIISIRCNPLNHKLIDPSPLFIKRLVFHRASGIIAQTEFAATQIKKMTNHSNIVVIPNYLRFIEDSEIIKKKHIINVSRFTKEKGHKYLLEAFSLIHKKDWKLILVGDGILRKSLMEYAEQLGISNHVEFIGEKNNVDFYLKQSEIFVFSSISEGFPNALLEAMATPLPCISFDCDAGPSEIICNMENGILVKTKDVISLAEKMSLLMEDEKLREKLMNNSIKVREQFRIDIIADRYFRFLLENLN